MPTIEPMIGPDIPPLPCIYQDDCEDFPEQCPCDEYKWSNDEDKPKQNPTDN